jgi:hypothetical protein
LGGDAAVPKEILMRLFDDTATMMPTEPTAPTPNNPPDNRPMPDVFWHGAGDVSLNYRGAAVELMRDEDGAPWEGRWKMGLPDFNDQAAFNRFFEPDHRTGGQWPWLDLEPWADFEGLMFRAMDEIDMTRDNPDTNPAAFVLPPED